MNGSLDLHACISRRGDCGNGWHMSGAALNQADKMVCSSVTVQRSVACGGSFQAPGEPLSHLGHQGSTPLYVAAERGHREVVQQLMAAGPLAVD